MIYGAATTLDGANDAATLNFNSAAAGNPTAVVSARFKGKATTNTTMIVIGEVLTPGTTDWTSTGMIDMKSLQIVAAGNVSVADSTDFDYMMPDVGATAGARLRVVSIVSGSESCTPIGLFANEVPRSFLPVTLAQATQNITSTSANALTVGPNGTTNPTFKVNANTGSAATGVEIVGAAAASGVLLRAISSGTDEELQLAGKGAGNIVMNSAGTGITLFTTGAQLADAKNIVLGSSTGNKIGTATTQKLGFFNATPVVQPVANTDTTTGSAGSVTGVFLNTTFTGLGGSAAFTIGGVVTKLKALGLLAA